MEIFLNILGVLAIIGVGSLVTILISEFIISLFDNHQGVFFNRAKKQKKVVNNEEAAQPENDMYVSYDYDQNIDVTPSEEKVEEPKALVANVDRARADEEQKMIESSIVADDDIYDDDDDEVDEEFNAQMKSIMDEAIANRDNKPEPVKPAPVVEPEPVKEEPQVIEREKVVVVKKDDSEEIRKLRDLRKSILTKKQESMEKEQQNVKELEEIEKEYNALKAYKIQSRQNIIKLKTENLEEMQRKHDENQELKKEVAKLKRQGNTKPYFTRDYYEKKHEDLTEDIRQAERDLRENKKEYIPLQKVKRAYEKDSDKLRKKEISVAKQKISLYGVGASSKVVDPEKKQKLDEEVKSLNELKDSVASCEQVLKTNKDRLVALEKTNKVLTRQLEKLRNDLKSVDEALAWYDKHGTDGNK